MWYCYLSSFLVILFAFYLFLVFPARRNRVDFSVFHHRIIAHRGMFSTQENIPENTLPAFQRAISGGYGIETDVHITKDNYLVICHDSNLKRVFGVDLIIEDHDYADFASIEALGTKETVPLFTDFLHMVNGQVPLIIELKGQAKEDRMVPFVKEALASYNGPYLIETFNPIILRSVKKEMPDVIRGILSSQTFTEKTNPVILFAATQLLYNALFRPDFVAYEFHGGDSWQVKLVCRLLGAHPVAWTIRQEEDAVYSKERFETLICENIPQLFPEGQTKW